MAAAGAPGPEGVVSLGSPDPDPDLVQVTPVASVPSRSSQGWVRPFSALHSQSFLCFSSLKSSTRDLGLQPHSCALGVTPGAELSSNSCFAVPLKTLNVDFLKNNVFLVLNHLFLINDATIIEMSI